MTNDAFVAFFVGIGVGIVVGIIAYTFLTVVRQNEERRERDYETRRNS